jgi:Protein of unknown function (DUF3015)
MRLVMTSALLAIALTGPAAWAQEGETANSSGCGLGTMLFDGQAGVGPQVLAVTTNGTSGNQTFGITSGTLGCTKDGVVRPPAEVRVLLMSSLDGLAADVARGQGETLASLANLMAIDEADQERFFVALQGSFVRIFPTEAVTADEVITSINAVMAEDEVLARYLDA